MRRPYSLASRDRSSVWTKVPSVPQISLAISSSRQLFDISPGQVFSLRDEQLTIRMQDACFLSSCSLRAASIAFLAAIQSTARSYLGSAKPLPAFLVTGDLRELV